MTRGKLDYSHPWQVFTLLQLATHASLLRMPREKKCLADTIDEFELYDSPLLLEDVS